MNINKKVVKKFNKLLEEGQKILQDCGWDGKRLDDFPSELDYMRWRTEALNLLKRACGENSEHYKQLSLIAQDKDSKLRNDFFTHCYGVVEAAKNDFDDDFLTDITYLIRADLLDDLLSQAEMLLESTYHIAAASLAGGVLEDTLRKLCDKNKIAYPDKTKIDALNSSLAKAKVYDKLVQKQITANADIRNNADHGHSDKVKHEDVEDMLKWLRRFIRDYMK